MTKIAYIPPGVILGVVSIQAQVQQHLEREVHKIITFDSEIDFIRVFVLANLPYGTKGLGMLVLAMLNENWRNN